jgi:uncharacterized protein YciI
MPHFLYRLRVTRVGMLTEGPTEREAAVVGEHFQRLKKLTEEGVVLVAGRTLNNDERTIGIVVFEAGSEAEASAIMKADPCVAQGVMTADLFPFGVALWSKKGPGTG